jgi:RimJ/RimL family protein N-acetyltransferase
MGIRGLTGDDAELYRTIRLRALSADPDAFASTHERESEFDESTWRTRLAGFRDRPGRVFIDESGGEVTGIVGIGLAEDATDSVLWGMWIDPGARGSGVGQRLVGETLIWARAQDCATVTLWVMRCNEIARRFYERCGFVLQDEVGVDAPDDCSDELRMQRILP